MKNFVKFLTIIILIIQGLYSPVFSQACGEGEFNFEFYVLNGEKIENLQFEVFPVNDEAFKAVFTQYQQDVFWANLYHGSIIETEFAEKIVSIEKDSNLNGLLTQSDLDNSGTIKGGTLWFHTYETYSTQYLLKITYDDKTTYILANLFGGCDRTSKVLFSWRPKPIILHID